MTTPKSPKRGRGRPPFTRHEQIKNHAHRFVLLWLAVRHIQGELHAAGVKSPRKLALIQVAAAERAAGRKMTVHTLRNLLKKGLKGVPADVRVAIERELPGLRETYRAYEEQAQRLPALQAAQAKEQYQAERLLAELSPADRAVKQVAANYQIKTAAGELKQMHEFELWTLLRKGDPERMPADVRALLKFLK